MKRVISIMTFIGALTTNAWSLQLKGIDARNLFEELPIDPIVLCKKNQDKNNQDSENILLKVAVEKKVYFGFKISPTELDNIRNQEQNTNSAINKRTRCVRETYETEGETFNRFNCEVEFVPVSSAMDTYSAVCD